MLRQTLEDIPLLAGHFLGMFAREMGMGEPRLHGEALALLEGYAFPGNVRELKNIIERALIESGGGEIRPEHLHLFQGGASALPAEVAPMAQAAGLPLNLAQAERLLVERALEQTRGNIAAAARLLGTNRPHIYRVLEEERKES